MLFNILSDIGLLMFALGIVIGAVALIDDGWRVITKKTTITEWVVQKWYRTLYITGAASLIPIGLAMHFIFFR